MYITGHSQSDGGLVLFLRDWFGDVKSGSQISVLFMNLKDKTLAYLPQNHCSHGNALVAFWFCANRLGKNVYFPLEIDPKWKIEFLNLKAIKHRDSIFTITVAVILLN